jgi:hypothetical protein
LYLSWAFSSAAALEGQLFKNFKKSYDLSEQNLVDCAHSETEDGCEPSDDINAYTYMINYGVMIESEYPVS